MCPSTCCCIRLDEQYLTEEQQDRIQDAQMIGGDAYNSGDQAGMDAAHDAAEAERATAIFRRDDGSEYHPWGDDDSGRRRCYYYTPATYTITATAGTGGSISPSGSTSVAEGNSKTYTITANSGYTISNVKVDGSSIGASSTFTSAVFHRPIPSVPPSRPPLLSARAASRLATAAPARSNPGT